MNTASFKLDTARLEAENMRNAELIALQINLGEWMRSLAADYQDEPPAFHAAALEVIEKIHSFNRKITYLRNIEDRTHENPDVKMKRLEEQLGVTRSAIYQNLDKIGIPMDAFRTPPDSAYDLFVKSNRLQMELEEIQDLIFEVTGLPFDAVEEDPFERSMGWIED